VDLTSNDIPDDILNFETKGRKYTRVSKLRYPLEGIDLKVLDIFDVDSLNEMEEDVTLLLAMLRKRREQLTKPKEECRFSHKIYKDRSSKKQMIKLHVGKYHPVHDNKGNFLYTHEETLYEIRLPFKKSDAAGIDAVNQKIKEINEKYKLKVS